MLDVLTTQLITTRGKVNHEIFGVFSFILGLLY